MHRLPLLARLLCTQPSLSDAGIGRLVGRSARTVRRYRRIIDDRGLLWQRLESRTAVELDEMLNVPRYRPLVKTEPDPEAIAGTLSEPAGTLKRAWEEYVRGQPAPHIGFSHFRKRWARHRLGTDLGKPRRDGGASALDSTPSAPGVVDIHTNKSESEPFCVVGRKGRQSTFYRAESTACRRSERAKLDSTIP